MNKKEIISLEEILNYLKTDKLKEKDMDMKDIKSNTTYSLLLDSRYCPQCFPYCKK